MRHADLGGEALWRGGHRRGVCSSQIKQMFTVAVCVRKNKHSFKPPSTDPPPTAGEQTVFVGPACTLTYAYLPRAQRDH